MEFGLTKDVNGALIYLIGDGKTSMSTFSMSDDATVKGVIFKRTEEAHEIGVLEPMEDVNGYVPDNGEFLLTFTNLASAEAFRNRLDFMIALFKEDAQ